MDDTEILARISEMVQAEHDLRIKEQADPATAEQATLRLKELEESLDQCWDLLRQRRARREFHQDPDGAGVRPVSEVEGYLR